MGRTIPSTFNTERIKLFNDEPWLLLLEVQVNDTDSFYLTNALETVTMDGDDYDPYPININEITNAANGELSEIEVTVSNITRQLMAYVETGNGLSGKVILVHIINLNNPNDNYTEKYQILTCNATDEDLVFKCSQFLLQDLEFPGAFTTRDFCRWVFGSDECGLDITNINLYDSGVDSPCTKKISGNYGCEFWGDREVADALDRKHPQRYGAFPSLPAGLRIRV